MCNLYTLPADFFKARGVAVLLNEVLQVVENFALALGEWQHVIALQLRPLYAKERRRSTFVWDLGHRNARIVRRGPAVLTDGAKEHRADNLVVHHLSVVDRMMTAFWAARVVGHVRYVSGENGLPIAATAAAAIFTTLNPQVA